MKPCKCGNIIPQQRLNLGYTVCVNCSTEVKCSAIQVIHHKTGNETQIVKDPEVAAEFYAKSQRTGFGTLKGMTGFYKKQTPPKQTRPRKEKALPPPPPPMFNVLARKPMPLDFEGVGKSVMEAMDQLGAAAAVEVITQAEKEHRILAKQARQLREIVTVLTAAVTVTDAESV